jgi:serine/threonine protein kinase
MVERFKAKFLKEARRMHELKHPNIVGVLDIFEENGTAYYVMEYAENGSLVDKLKREGRLAEDVAVKYILQIANALLYIHNQELNHLDIKPANIVLTAENKPMLIDFGLSKHYDLATGSQTSTTPVGISEGYAPMEQYRQGGVGTFSPETDIYSLGATLYKLITGITPPSAPDLIDNGGFTIKSLKEQGLSSKVASVISKSMKIRKTDRTKNVQVFIAGLEGLPTSPKTPMLNIYDEKTMPLVEHEQKEVKARAKVEAERKARQEAARRRREEEERKRQEEERKRREIEKQGDNSGFGCLSLLVILLLVCIVDPLGLIHLKSGLLDNSFGILIYLCIVAFGGGLLAVLIGFIFRRL